MHNGGNQCKLFSSYKEEVMRNSYDYIEGRLAEQRSHAEQRRRVAAARARRGSTERFSDLLRRRPGRSDQAGTVN